MELTILAVITGEAWLTLTVERVCVIDTDATTGTRHAATLVDVWQHRVTTLYVQRRDLFMHARAGGPEPRNA